MSHIDQARDILQDTNSTCVFYDGNTVIKDTRRGVKPLLELLESKTDLKNFSAADKVVGKAAAYLYCLLGIETLYAGVISQPALEVLLQRNIHVTYGTLVSSIQNRTHDGPCPMEHAVWEIDSPEEALAAIYKTLKALAQQ